MSVAFLPDPGEARPARVGFRELALVFAGSVVLALLFWAPLLFGGPLGGHDWSTHHFHYFDWTSQAFRLYGSFPLFMSDAWVTPNFIANAEAPTLGPLVWMLGFLAPGAYIKLLIVLFCALGLGGGWLLARDLGAASPIAAFVAGGYAFGGFFASHLAAGHHWAMGAWLLPGFVWLVRRAVLGSNGALVAAAIVNAFTIGGGQHQPFIWQNLLLGFLAILWCLRVRALFPLWRSSGIVLLSFALGAVKIVPMLLEFGTYAPAARISGLPPGVMLSSLFARGQSLDRVDAALAYDFGAGWWEYAFYLGPVAAALLIVGMVASRRVWPLLVLAAVALVMSLEPSPWALVQDWPVLRTQRCPARFTVLALFAGLFAAATGLERLRQLAAARGLAGVALVAWALAVLAVGDLWLESRVWQAEATGAAVVSRTHRPEPEVLRAAGASATLSAFTPNEVRYALEASAASRLVFPLRYGLREAEWEVSGDVLEIERSDVWLAAQIAEGSGEMVLRFRPPGLAAGLAISLVSGLALLACAVRARGRATA